MSYEDPPDHSGGRRRGRPARRGDPVTVVSISMNGSLLAEIDEERSRGTHRGRSSWVRWVLRSYIRLKRREREEKSAYADSTAEYERDFDPTHGGRFDPSLIGQGTWECAACAAADDAVPATLNQRVVTGWKACPGCKTPRGDAPTIPPEPEA